jgi:hypothetical protein
MMILIVLLACVVPFFIKGLDERPLMTLEYWKMDMPELPMDLLTEAVQESVPVTPEVTEGYRWQDENGVWQFSNNPNDALGPEVMVRLTLSNRPNCHQLLRHRPRSRRPRRSLVWRRWHRIRR